MALPQRTIISISWIKYRRGDRPPASEKMPDLMAEKDDRLYVHTYSYDYVIEIGNHTEINQIYLNAVEELENTGYLPNGDYCYVDNGTGFENKRAGISQ